MGMRSTHQSTTRFTKVACLEHRRALVSVSSVKNTSEPPDLFDKKVNLVNLLKKEKVVNKEDVSAIAVLLTLFITDLVG